MSSDEEDAPTVLVATRVDEYDGPIRQRKNVCSLKIIVQL